MWGGTNQYWILGYNHIGKTLEIINIELSSLYERHAKAMDKKVFYDKQQKEKKKFKRRRNQLS